MADPSGDIAPSTAINDRDHGAVVKVTAAFCAALTLLSLCARLQIRWPWRSLFARDDAVAAAATTVAIAQMATIVHAVHEGFGKVSDDLSPESIEAVHKVVYASDILFVAALFLAKVAVALLYQRLSSDPSLSRAATALTIVAPVCGLISVVLTIIPTSASSPWTYDNDNQTGRIACWIAIAAMSNAIELGLVAFPVWLVKGLQMRRSPKILIVLAAWLRLPLIPISILRLLDLRTTISTPPDFPFAYTTTEIYSQIEMTLALLTATALCLHKFLRSANSGGVDMTIGTHGALTTLYGTGKSGSGGGGRSREQHTASQRSGGAVGVKLSNLGRQHTSQVTRADSISAASDSSQRKIVVRSTVDVEYERPDTAERKEWPLQSQRPDGSF